MPRVLVIDDDPSIHELIARLLGPEGFRMQAASNGEGGLRLARELRPMAITLDVMMPSMDGWAVLLARKGDPELCDIPVIMLAIVDEQNLGYALGVSAYLTKPIDRSRLLSIMQKHRQEQAVCKSLIVEDHAETRQMVRRILEAGLDGDRGRERPGRPAADRAAAARDHPAGLDDAGDGWLRLCGGASEAAGVAFDPDRRDHRPGRQPPGSPAVERVR
jgi:CheY-like chemotaxis protein